MCLTQDGVLYELLQLEPNRRPHDLTVDHLIYKADNYGDNANYIGVEEMDDRRRE